MKINDTSSYHRQEMESLGWELTVCNMLEEALSPARGILEKSDTFGNLLLQYLGSFFSLDKFQTICEIGGGYGFIMRDFLSSIGFSHARMIDISPYLLARQRETLAAAEVPIDFIEKDFLAVENEWLKDVDLAILNENIGDFPTLCGVTAEEILGGSKGDDFLFDEGVRISSDYHLPLHEGTFHLNIGALLACEKLCNAGIKLIYMSEHSCEAEVPESLKGLVHIESEGRPERISLKGHDEYSIQFSYLEMMAQSLGYRVIRGNYGDILKIDFSDRVNFIMRSGSSRDDHEIIRHFVEDVYKYEYLVLIRE